MRLSKSSRHRFIVLLTLACIGIAISVGKSPVHSQGTPPQKIESDDTRVAKTGTWLAQAAPAASGGKYLYNAVSPSANLERGSGGEVALILNFSGPSLEIIYVSGPSLGTLAIEVDGTVLRTVITTAENTVYQQSAQINYLTDEPHELKVYAQAGGTVAIDAFIVSPSINMERGPGGEVSSLADPRFPLCNPSDETQLVTQGPNAPFSIPNYTARPKISADGRYIAFASWGNPAGGTIGSPPNVFVYDRSNCAFRYVVGLGTHSPPTLLQPPINNPGDFQFSRNGRYVAISTHRTYLPQDNSICYWGTIMGTIEIPCESVYRYDLVTNQIELVSLNNNQSETPAYLSAISGDGNIVVFENSGLGVVARNMQTNTTIPVSVAMDGTQAEGHASAASGDGRYIVFESAAANLVPNDTNEHLDVFVRDIVAGTTTRVSVDSNGTPTYFYPSTGGAISSDGRYIGFISGFPLLVAGDSNGVADAFIHDRQTGQTTRVSVASDGTQANGPTLTISIPGNGPYVGFTSNATNLVAGDTNNRPDLFLHNLQTGETVRVGIQTPDPTSIWYEFSADTNTVTYSEAERVYVRTLGAPPDRLALWNNANGAMALELSQHTPPPALAVDIFSPGPPATGQMVMGDWDGDGTKSAGIYADSGVFYYTNQNAAAATWSAVWIGLLDRPPVAGHFDGGVNHDCIGAVDSANFPPYGTAFALYFTCDLTPDTAPALTFQWISVLLPDSAGFSGTHQFGAGDFNGDGVDSIAVRRGEFIAFTNDAPTTPAANFPLAQYFGTPATSNEGTLVVGDWDGNALDSFGLFYQAGALYWRDDLGWNSQIYFNQQLGQPIGASGIQVGSWH